MTDPSGRARTNHDDDALGQRFRDAKLEVGIVKQQEVIK
jgi:hypothetical protein